MHSSNHGFASSIRRLWGRLAIGQILREDYRYEVHGPFVAAGPVSPARGLHRRLAERGSIWLHGFTSWSHARRGATMCLIVMLDILTREARLIVSKLQA